jgi:hypothetical protein
MNCIVCGSPNPDMHHVTTKGAGGDDSPSNLMPLCRRHHQEYHYIGPVRMFCKYPSVQQWLEDNGREDILKRARRVTSS